MNQQQRKRILRLIREVNRHKPIGVVYPALQYHDDGWRFIFEKSLEYPEYQQYSAGKKLMKMAIFDRDFDGEYYWIPYDASPNGYTSSGLRLLQMLQKEVEV